MIYVNNEKLNTRLYTKPADIYMYLNHIQNTPHHEEI